MENVRHAKVLNVDELVFLLERYNIKLINNKIYVNLKTKKKQDSFFKNDQTTNKIFFYSNPFKKFSFNITPKVKKIFVSNQGELNLLLLQNIQNFYKYQNKDINDVNPEVLKKVYKDLLQDIFANTGTFY